MDGNQVSKQTPAAQFAQALMLEQIAFIRQQLLLDKNSPYLERIIHHLYNHADQILLKDVIQLESLHGVVRKYAFELNLGPDILEFIGHASQKVHQLILRQPTPIIEFFSDESFELWVNKCLELEQLREYMQKNLHQNPQIQQLSLQLANQILENYTPWLNQLRTLKAKQHSLASRVLGFLQDQQQQLKLKLEQQLAHAILKQIGYIITLPKDELAEIILEIWESMKHRPIRDFYAQIESLDIEDFFILVYETWRSLRKTPYLQAIVLDVVSSFYEYFGDYNLQELLEAVGLDETDLLEETYRFSPHYCQALDRLGLLEPLIQAYIAPFYEATQTHAFIAKYLDEHPN